MFFGSKYMCFFQDFKVKFCARKLKNALFVVSSQHKASSLVCSPGVLAAEQRSLWLLACQRDCEYLLPLVPGNRPEPAQI